MPYLNNEVGLSSTRTPGRAAPPTMTCPTPLIRDRVCDNTLAAASYNCPTVSVCEVSARMTIGASAGLTFQNVGLLRRVVGKSARAALIAACTSRAAPLMSRFRPNCSTIRTDSTELMDVISVTSAIWPKWRSSGAATLDATVSGLAPGNVAWTEIVGKSTCGSGETGSLKNAKIPASAMPMVSNTVATGRAMNGADIFIPPGALPVSRRQYSRPSRTRRDTLLGGLRRSQTGKSTVPLSFRGQPETIQI